MTMTASLKNKLLVLAKLVSALITAILVLWLLNTVKGCGWKWHTIICLSFCGLVILWEWLANQYKKKISLSAEERSKPLETYLDFSNSIDWFPIVSWVVLASLVFLVLIPFKNGYPAVTHNIVALCVYVVAMLPFFLAPRRNRYIIDGDVLIVQEFDLFRMTTDLSIPIKAIEKVYIADLFTLTPRVIIVVNGIERKLRCTSHTEELAKALLLRIPS